MVLQTNFSRRHTLGRERSELLSPANPPFVCEEQSVRSRRGRRTRLLYKGIMLMTEQLEVTTTLLEALETAVVPAIRSPVTIRDGFKKNASIRISAIFAEFKKPVFSTRPKAPHQKVTYRKYELLCICADGPIISELGGGTKSKGPLPPSSSSCRRNPRPGGIPPKPTATPISSTHGTNKASCAPSALGGSAMVG